MKAKKGYKNLKNKVSTGKWLKHYFEKRTCRRRQIDPFEEYCPVCGYYCLGSGGDYSADFHKKFSDSFNA